MSGTFAGITSAISSKARSSSSGLNCCRGLTSRAAEMIWRTAYRKTTINGYTLRLGLGPEEAACSSDVSGTGTVTVMSFWLLLPNRTRDDSTLFTGPPAKGLSGRSNRPKKGGKFVDEAEGVTIKPVTAPARK